jgi:hypothetical protein
VAVAGTPAPAPAVEVTVTVCVTVTEGPGDAPPHPATASPTQSRAIPAPPDRAVPRRAWIASTRTAPTPVADSSRQPPTFVRSIPQCALT